MVSSFSQMANVEQVHAMLERERAAGLSQLGDQTARLADGVKRQQHATLIVARSYVQMCYALLQMSQTTRIDATRERCLSNARRLCDRLIPWVERYPYLHDLRVDIEDLTHHLK